MQCLLIIILEFIGRYCSELIKFCNYKCSFETENTYFIAVKNAVKYFFKKVFKLISNCFKVIY